MLRGVDHHRIDIHTQFDPLLVEAFETMMREEQNAPEHRLRA
jgi:hypothetical protein